MTDYIKRHRNIKRHIKYMQEGSYTVEAAFLVPIILGLIFLILYVLFFLHDKAVLQANVQEVLCLVAEKQISCQKRECGERLGQSLWIAKITEMKVSENKTSYSVKVQARVDNTIPVIWLFMRDGPEMAVAEKCSKIQPDQVIRVRR